MDDIFWSPLSPTFARWGIPLAPMVAPPICTLAALTLLSNNYLVIMTKFRAQNERCKLNCSSLVTKLFSYFHSIKKTTRCTPTSQNVSTVDLLAIHVTVIHACIRLFQCIAKHSSNASSLTLLSYDACSTPLLKMLQVIRTRCGWRCPRRNSLVSAAADWQMWHPRQSTPHAVRRRDHNRVDRTLPGREQSTVDC